MMARYRCNHCRGIFEAGGIRDCCLNGAVAEQRRLREKVAQLDAARSFDELRSMISDLLYRRGRGA